MALDVSGIGILVQSFRVDFWDSLACEREVVDPALVISMVDLMQTKWLYGRDLNLYLLISV